MFLYPKEFDANLRYRYDLQKDCERNPQLAAHVRELVTRRDDKFDGLLFFFNVFAFTYDPRSKYKNLPFITYKFQDENIIKINDCIEKGEDLFIDKSRDMGASYMVLYVFLWRWLTKRSEEFRVGSRKEEYVDKSGDMDTLFEKMRYCLNKLPAFLLPNMFDLKKHSPYMRLINPEMSSAIIGEATNKDFARGGRKKAVLFDEFQAWEMAEEAWRSATDATPCKICVGTPQGAGTKQAELGRSDEMQNKMRLFWYYHPLKSYTSPEYMTKLRNGEVTIKGEKIRLHENQSLAKTITYYEHERALIGEGLYVDNKGRLRSEWYDRECARRNKDDIAENLDIDYLTSGDPVFDTTKCLENKSRCVPPVAIGELHWKITPVFDINTGYCTNWDKLAVEFVENMNGVIKIWEHPQKLDEYDDGYCIAADVAEGLAQGDFDSASVLKRFDELKTVGAIHGKMKTFEYAEELAKLAVYYGYAYVTPERNNTMGGAVLEQLFKIYRKIYHAEVFTKGYATRTDKLGWNTSSGTKGQIIGNLSKHISQDLWQDPDEGFWAECLTFIKNDGKMEAQGKSQGNKCYDDRVMDRAILLWTNTQLPLPSRKIRRVKYTGWRSSWNKNNNNKSLVRFTV